MSYEDHLDRAIERTPEIDHGNDRFSIPDPEVRSEGHATVVENFADIVDRLAREESHVLKGLQSALGTSARIDESGRARLTGDFDGDRVGEALAEYVEGYVECPECGLPDTRLETEHGAEMIVCDACGARSPAGN